MPALPRDAGSEKELRGERSCNRKLKEQNRSPAAPMKQLDNNASADRSLTVDAIVALLDYTLKPVTVLTHGLEYNFGTL